MQEYNVNQIIFYDPEVVSYKILSLKRKPTSNLIIFSLHSKSLPYINLLNTLAKKDSELRILLDTLLEIKKDDNNIPTNQSLVDIFRDVVKLDDTSDISKIFNNIDNGLDIKLSITEISDKVFSVIYLFAVDLTNEGEIAIRCLLKPSLAPFKIELNNLSSDFITKFKYMIENLDDKDYLKLFYLNDMISFRSLTSTEYRLLDIAKIKFDKENSVPRLY